MTSVNFMLGQTKSPIQDTFETEFEGL